MFILYLLSSALALAEQDRDKSGFNVSARLKHRIVIPKILYFRVGPETAVSKVKFDLSNSAVFSSHSIGNRHTYNGTPRLLGDSLPIEETFSTRVSVDLRANVGTVTISYRIDNPSGLVNAKGKFIPYEQISVVSDDDELPAPRLANSANHTSIVSGNFFSARVIKRMASWTYRYRSEQIPLGGTYSGRVTYIASSP
jgi:hypothetical protein